MKTKSLVALIIALFFLSGCSKITDIFNPDMSFEDKVEIGLYNSLQSAEVTYTELVEYAREHEHLFSEEDKERINDVSDKYTQAMVTALTAWYTYKLRGEETDLETFVFQATEALREMRILYEMVKGVDYNV